MCDIFYQAQIQLPIVQYLQLMKIYGLQYIDSDKNYQLEKAHL